MARSSSTPEYLTAPLTSRLPRRGHWTRLPHLGPPEHVYG